MREIRITYRESSVGLRTITRRAEKIIRDVIGDVYVFSGDSDTWIVGVASDSFVTYEIKEVSDSSTNPPAGTGKSTVRH